MSVAVWSAEEKAILDSVVLMLDNNRCTAERKQMQKSIHTLEVQAWAIGRYPSILENNRLGNTERSIETLVAALTEKYATEDLFAMPSKAVAGRSFIVAKVNLFYMLLLLIGDDSTMEGLATRVRECILHAIIGVLTEDVLMELISDRNTYAAVKDEAVRLLAKMWEFRTDPEVGHFNPVLARLWIERKKSLPIYGTLMGTYEYLHLSGKVDEICRDYIFHAATNTEETDALEEFLFGIRYEDLDMIRQRMVAEQKTSIDRKAIAAMLEKDSVFLCSENKDPMELYRFFNLRKKSAIARRNANVKGPVRTLEQNLFSYLLIKNLG